MRERDEFKKRKNFTGHWHWHFQLQLVGCCVLSLTTTSSSSDYLSFPHSVLWLTAVSTVSSWSTVCWKGCKQKRNWRKRIFVVTFWLGDLHTHTRTLFSWQIGTSLSALKESLHLSTHPDGQQLIHQHWRIKHITSLLLRSLCLFSKPIIKNSIEGGINVIVIDQIKSICCCGS